MGSAVPVLVFADVADGLLARTLFVWELLVVNPHSGILNLIVGLFHFTLDSLHVGIVGGDCEAGLEREAARSETIVEGF